MILAVFYLCLQVGEGFLVITVWTGLELFFKTPCIKGLSRGHFLGAPRGSPFNINLTFSRIRKMSSTNRE